MTRDVDTGGIARGHLISLDDQRLVFEPAHSSYQLELVPLGPVTAEAGERIAGFIEGQALRMFVAKAGGAFIEPLWGVPRIVQGRIRAVDAGGQRLLVAAAAPIWVMVGDAQQSAAQFAPGQMVNFYMQSGPSFRQVSGT